MKPRSSPALLATAVLAMSSLATWCCAAAEDGDPLRGAATISGIVRPADGANASGTTVQLIALDDAATVPAATWWSVVLAGVVMVAFLLRDRRRGALPLIAAAAVTVSFLAIAHAALVAQTTSDGSGAYLFSAGAGGSFANGRYRVDFVRQGYYTVSRLVELTNVDPADRVIADVRVFPLAAEPGCSFFPADNPWNQDVTGLPLHERSDGYINTMGRSDTLHPDFGTYWEGAPIGIPYVTVPGTQPRVPVSFTWADESDSGPYPIPPDAPIEGGPDSDGDRHVLVLDRDACTLYETYNSWPQNGGTSWVADAGAIFDLSSNALRPDGWTSADAAGLPILPGLVRYDEVKEHGVIRHAVRFTVSQSQRGYIHPATHAASSSQDPNRAPMGLRLRMKISYDCSSYSEETRIICAALQQYGMIVADNGSDWYISGAPDDRWDDEALGDLKRIPGDAFEVVYTGDIIPY
ncbi:MAG: hypothetical protein HYV63_14060 [Candidatus Schekmanbacteria bacterium]|nr:hypothetical protein [Candidatus Schekmanbacteria bacterium]